MNTNWFMTNRHGKCLFGDVAFLIQYFVGKLFAHVNYLRTKAHAPKLLVRHLHNNIEIHFSLVMKCANEQLISRCYKLKMETKIIYNK